jgi:predicted metal-dependent hydrolase
MSRRTPAPKPGRPRDPDASPKPARPRDELGRPLARGSPNLLHLEDYDSLSVDENHRLGIEHFDAGRFFPAHEAWETSWKQSKGSTDAEFFKGLSQLGAGYVHLLRGNPHGAFTLLRRGAGRIRPYGQEHRGVKARRLADAALAHAEVIERTDRTGTEVPRLTFPRISG